MGLFEREAIWCSGTCLEKARDGVSFGMADTGTSCDSRQPFSLEDLAGCVPRVQLLLILLDAALRRALVLQLRADRQSWACRCQCPVSVVRPHLQQKRVHCLRWHSSPLPLPPLLLLVLSTMPECGLPTRRRDPSLRAEGRLR